MNRVLAAFLSAGLITVRLACAQVTGAGGGGASQVERYDGQKIVRVTVKDQAELCQVL